MKISLPENNSIEYLIDMLHVWLSHNFQLVPRRLGRI